MNDEEGKKLLEHLQAKFDALPPGTVLVPPTSCPTCGCSNAGGIDELCPCECHGGTFFEEDRENMRIHDDTPLGEDPLDRLPTIVESVPTYNSEETRRGLPSLGRDLGTFHHTPDQRGTRRPLP